MSTLHSSAKVYGISLACMSCGAMVADILDHLLHGRFSSFYAAHPIQVWITLPINGAVIYLLVRRARQVLRGRHESAEGSERAGIEPSLLGLKFRTTPFIRICVYSGGYLLGV